MTKFATSVEILWKHMVFLFFSLDIPSYNFLAIFAKIRVHLYRKWIISMYTKSFAQICTSEAEYKRKPLPELTITSTYVDSNTFTMGNPMPELTLSPSQGLRIWPLENTHWPTYIDGWPGTPISQTWLIAGRNTLGGKSFRGRPIPLSPAKSALMYDPPNGQCWPPWTACVHFPDSYPIDLSHLSFNFNFLCLLLLLEFTSVSILHSA